MIHDSGSVLELTSSFLVRPHSIIAGDADGRHGHRRPRPDLDRGLQHRHSRRGTHPHSGLLAHLFLDCLIWATKRFSARFRREVRCLIRRNHPCVRAVFPTVRPTRTSQTQPKSRSWASAPPFLTGYAPTQPPGNFRPDFARPFPYP